MRFEYDPEANAAFVEVTKSTGFVTSVDADDAVILDYRDGELAGIEILNAKPRPRLAKIAAEHGFGHLLDDIYMGLDTVLSWQVSGPATAGPVVYEMQVPA